MGTSYPLGVDGAQVMAKTAERLQEFLREHCLGDETVAAIDTDMLEVKISGMAARFLTRQWDDLAAGDAGCVCS